MVWDLNIPNYGARNNFSNSNASTFKCALNVILHTIEATIQGEKSPQNTFGFTIPLKNTSPKMAKAWFLTQIEF